MVAAKEAYSWSKPEGNPRLIGRKQVDWSVFESGTTIPTAFHEDFAVANGGELPEVGRARDVVLIVDGVEHKARLVNVPRQDSVGGALQIRYDTNADLKAIIAERFAASYRYLADARTQQAQSGKKKIYARTVRPEFIEFEATEVPFRYVVRFVTNPLSGQSSFEKVWTDLGDIIGDRASISTLARGHINAVRWLADTGIEVITDKSTQTIPKADFGQVWEALRLDGMITAQQFPGNAAYRSSAIAAILSLLPYVEYLTEPRLTLFLTDRVFTHAELSQTFSVGAMGGIRYQGKADETRLVLFITGSSEATGDDHPYHDRWDGETFLYTGEGLNGDQKLSSGNLVLSRNESADFPVFGFRKESQNQYAYMGRFKVIGHRQEVQPDSTGAPRKVFIFEMRRAKPHSAPPVSEESEEMEVTRDLTTITQEFSTMIAGSGISFGARHEAVVRAFVASLAAKRFVILTGLSGSGKTQIAIGFGKWFGDGRSLLVPVRPDWTGPEALLGYEDALQPIVDGRPAWHVPEPLKFMLRAARDSGNPYLLILDEMNLAHVERYFADVLSGMESREACLPNLAQEDDGHWRAIPNQPEKIEFPANLFVVGTVNVDETTYMFSPKVLDRANTIEFRVDADDLTHVPTKPTAYASGRADLVRGFLNVSSDDQWHLDHPATMIAEFQAGMRTLHRILATEGYEFGHRVFYEASRFASMMESAGDGDVNHILDLQTMQKVLPRLHGTRKRLEKIMCALGLFCTNPNVSADEAIAADFDPLQAQSGKPALPTSFEKVRRMLRNLRANQFVSFSE